ncbi:hypothetical protein KUCAC02_005433, partial [Chaenocephalus aceratus]
RGASCQYCEAGGIIPRKQQHNINPPSLSYNKSSRTLNLLAGGLKSDPFPPPGTHLSWTALSLRD